MRLNNQLRSLGTLLLLAPVFTLPATAQAEKTGQKAQEPAKPVEASAVKRAAALPVTITLKGLTPENSDQVVKAMEGLTQTIYVCSKCAEVHSSEGKCCDMELTPQKETVIQRLKADANNGDVAVTLKPGHSLELTRLEGALATMNVLVDRERLRVPASFEITLAGIQGSEGARKLETALKGEALMQVLSVQLDDTDKQVHLFAKVESPLPAFKDIQRLISKADSKAQVANLTWGAPCADCREAGMAQADCVKCWPDAVKG